MNTTWNNYYTDCVCKLAATSSISLVRIPMLLAPRIIFMVNGIYIMVMRLVRNALTTNDSGRDIALSCQTIFICDCTFEGVHSRGGVCYFIDTCAGRSHHETQWRCCKAENRSGNELNVIANPVANTSIKCIL